MPVDADLPIPAPECAALSLTAGQDSSEPMIVTSSHSEQRVEELERANKQLEARVVELETALAESRRIIRDREQLLSTVQWKPKDDFYVWKNPKFSDKQIKDEMESRLQTLMDQMRVMEKVLVDREQEIDFLAAQLNTGDSSSVSSFMSSIGSPAIRGSPAPKSPKFSVSYPVRSQAQGPSWSRSPMASPAVSPAQPKKQWWSSPFGNSLGDSTGHVPPASTGSTNMVVNVL